ncbi:MAG: (d)CMP kinase [Eubacteriales bacterium]|jgi:cytidylate kinase|nr:(d)CMP kinase [Eubacteriales bacterium]MDD4105654.1 (d)CMP kinase [Eubacteriales bacterium]MDD4711135.1 (d)CMP kinase [Eubacteriales bacterium]NLO15152.1 (d)CMP kinase [Clostridiales bacterium]
MMLVTIAIDGPVSAGKSTLSDAVARRLNILHLDTGAMYRAVGLAALQNGIDPHDQEAVERIFLDNKAQVGIEYENERQRTLLNGQDVSQLIRTEEVGLAASAVSRYPTVRRYLVDTQRRLSEKTSILMDGRDIGTVVLPHAPVKIFLTASPEARARRRCLQLKKQGKKACFDEVLRDLVKRDEQDRGRAADPLRQADDAVLLDTSNLDFEQSVRAIMDIVEARYGQK